MKTYQRPGGYWDNRDGLKRLSDTGQKASFFVSIHYLNQLFNTKGANNG